jgi:hypothetical protein
VNVLIACEESQTVLKEFLKRTWEDSDARTAQERSKTFPGIAKAFAEQWG